MVVVSTPLEEEEEKEEDNFDTIIIVKLKGLENILKEKLEQERIRRRKRRW